MKMKKLSFALLVLTLPVFADMNFYPQVTHDHFVTGDLRDEALKNEIFALLWSPHEKVQGSRDILNSHCTGNCSSHITLGYDGARRAMFGKIDLRFDNRGYYLQDVYCNREVSRKDIGPNQIPSSTYINCEHTWPQSKFTHSFSIEMQKSDLHHLYTASSKANSMRGNNPFAELTEGKNPDSNCQDSLFGVSQYRGHDFLAFSPPVEHRGNVARALFYFSIRYKLPISPIQEPILRKWNNDDPVTREDIARNDAIEALQGDRNPFIDYPELPHFISDF